MNLSLTPQMSPYFQSYTDLNQYKFVGDNNEEDRSLAEMNKMFILRAS